MVKPPQGQTDSKGDSAEAEEKWWNEISIVHYPRLLVAFLCLLWLCFLQSTPNVGFNSIRAFCDMLAGEDYQEINSQYRLAVGSMLHYCHRSPNNEEAGSKRYDVIMHNRNRSG